VPTLTRPPRSWFFYASIVGVDLCLIRELAIRAQTFAPLFPREASQIHLDRWVNV
jgi:hypothetical protein